MRESERCAHPLPAGPCNLDRDHEGSHQPTIEDAVAYVRGDHEPREADDGPDALDTD